MRSGSATFYTFVLLLTLILVVYYVGAATNFMAFAQGAQRILYALTGRNQQGNFQGYPAGGTAVQSFNY